MLIFYQQRYFCDLLSYAEGVFELRKIISTIGFCVFLCVPVGVFLYSNAEKEIPVLEDGTNHFEEVFIVE